MKRMVLVARAIALLQRAQRMSNATNQRVTKDQIAVIAHRVHDVHRALGAREVPQGATLRSIAAALVLHGGTLDALEALAVAPAVAASLN
jgi:hypothetical protein